MSASLLWLYNHQSFFRVVARPGIKRKNFIEKGRGTQKEGANPQPRRYRRVRKRVPQWIQLLLANFQRAIMSSALPPRILCWMSNNAAVRAGEKKGAESAGTFYSKKQSMRETTPLLESLESELCVLLNKVFLLYMYKDFRVDHL